MQLIVFHCPVVCCLGRKMLTLVCVCVWGGGGQCMSNVPQLATYMLSGQWAAELNKTNPLGMHGEIAVSFAGLLRQIWSGQRSFADPRNFKASGYFYVTLAV